ncbi:MAG: nucleotidyltransferase substrate binding protein [Candidatus Peribacteraceae bacterium]|nr:nucleotidyltransferase substrate binding protein [Candidatus Peribacteraceae bacterium]MBP9850129.1 nucleotidyltransferase substrate binding protein [Candidatus Peribacteraceae bacterium]
MADTSSVRFRQRRENFNKSFDLLQRTLQREKLNEIERGGLIQFFEVTFELAWKCLGDYLESEGFTVTSPKKIFKQAFQSRLIEDGELWLQALEDRNLTTHTYDEQKSLEVERMIRTKYSPLLQHLHDTLSRL